MFNDILGFLKNLFGLESGGGCCDGDEGCKNMPTGTIKSSENINDIGLSIDEEFNIDISDLAPDGLPEESNLFSMTNAQLRQLAEDRGVCVLKKDVKDVLVKKILSSV